MSFERAALALNVTASAVSQRIKALLHPGDFAARIGGDEFVMIVDPAGHDAQPDSLAERLRAAIADPITLPGGDSYRLSVSIGVAVHPADGTDPTALLTAADAAMYADKLGKLSK